MPKKPSLYGDERVCRICGNPNVELHHVYGGVGRRIVSDREGCVVYLCHEHHQGRTGVHQNKAFREWLRADCQKRWEEREGKGHDDFIAMFGANYL